MKWIQGVLWSQDTHLGRGDLLVIVGGHPASQLRGFDVFIAFKGIAEI